MKTSELIVDMMNKFDEKVTPVPQELQQEPVAEVQEPSASFHTGWMIADGFTKAQEKKDFQCFMKQLGVIGK